MWKLEYTTVAEKSIRVLPDTDQKKLRMHWKRCKLIQILESSWLAR